MTGIYKITSPSGSVYIGQSSNIYKRWKMYRHNSKKQPLLNRSFKKHGVSSHLFEVIHLLPDMICQNVINDYEIVYIKKYSLLGCKMMNVRGGGSNGKLSESTKAKIGLANKISLIGNIPKNKGISFDDFHGKDKADMIRIKMSKKLTGRKLSEETILRRKTTYAKFGHPSLGKKASTELKKKLSDAHIGIQAGEKHPMSKLTNKDVEEIYLSCLTVKELSEKFKMTIQNIYFIKKGKTWKSVTSKL